MADIVKRMSYDPNYLWGHKRRLRELSAVLRDFYDHLATAREHAKVAKQIKDGLDGFRPLAKQYGVEVPELDPIPSVPADEEQR